MPDVASTGQRQSGFFKGSLDFLTGDADVGDMQLVMCEFGAEDDESPVTVGRHEAFRVALSEKTVLTVLKMIAKTPIEHARKGEALT